VHAQKRHTRDPEDEEANQRIGLDALVLGNRVLERKETRPNSRNHNAHCVRAVHVLHRKPEYREDCSAYDCDVGAPEAPGGTREDGEGRVVDYADCAVEGDDEGDEEEGEGDNAEGFAPCQADGDDG
jgi:hypothetical protein